MRRRVSATRFPPCVSRPRARPVPDSATVQDVRNLADLVRRAAERDADRPALRWHGGGLAVLDAAGHDPSGTLRHMFALGEARGPAPSGRRSFAELLAGSGDAAGRTTGGEDLAALLYTSGTSGSPKGAMLSHRALIAN